MNHLRQPTPLLQIVDHHWRRILGVLALLTIALVGAAAVIIVGPFAALLVAGSMLLGTGVLLGGPRVLERRTTRSLDTSLEERVAAATAEARERVAFEARRAEAVAIGSAEQSWTSPRVPGDRMAPAMLLQAYAASAAATPSTPEEQAVHARLVATLGAVDSSSQCASAWLN